MMPRQRGHKAELPDVAADQPTGTLERLAQGLRKVLAAPKHDTPKSRKGQPKRKN